MSKIFSGRRNGKFTKHFLFMLCMAGSLSFGTASADVIYSTFGDGISSPAYDAVHSWFLCGSSNGFGYSGAAVGFVPSGDYSVTSMDFALAWMSGTPAVVELRDDASGRPGSLLGSWTVGSKPGSAYAPFVEVEVPASGVLTSGLEYWVTVQPGTADTMLAWAWNAQGLTGPLSGTKDGITYPRVNSLVLPAFDVLGTPVPEPSTSIGGIAALSPADAHCS